MSQGDDLGIASAEELADEYERGADMLRRAIARVQQGHAPTVMVALCEEALREHACGAAEADAAEAERIGAAVTGAFGDGSSPVRYLVAGRPLALGGRTPLEVIACGEAPLLLYTLAALQHGLGA